MGLRQRLRQRHQRHHLQPEFQHLPPAGVDDPGPALAALTLPTWPRPASGPWRTACPTAPTPATPVTRQQLVALLFRYATLMGYVNDQRADLSIYPDASAVASYAVEPMQWSVANSIVAGTSDGTLNPHRHRYSRPVRGDPLPLLGADWLTGKGKIPNHAISRADPTSARLGFCGRVQAPFPTHGWGKQSVWLATRAAKRFLRADARTHFRRPRAEGQREKPGAARP